MPVNNHAFCFKTHLDIKYDAEKDIKQKFEAKQRTLQRVEDAKKKEAEQGKGKFKSISAAKLWFKAKC